MASSSASYDLGPKLNAYRRNWVREYVVWRVLDGDLDWFVLREGSFHRQEPDQDGLHKSGIFPGLWLDAAALLERKHARVAQTLQSGLSSREHADFVARLAAADDG